MSNTTSYDALAVHGTDPQFLVEKIIRTRIYESMYWKESCFGLSAETLIERAVDLQAVGGQYANQKPTEFLCLTLKLLQLQPSKDIVLEFLNNEDFKYLRALAALYIRLVGSPVDVYQYLEPLLNDFRKLRVRTSAGPFALTYMDEFVDELLREERVCDIILPRIPKRFSLEENDELPPRISILEEELEDEKEEKSDSEDSSSNSDSSVDTSRRRKKTQRSRSRSSSRSLSDTSGRNNRFSKRSTSSSRRYKGNERRSSRSSSRKGRRHRRSRSSSLSSRRSYSRSRSRS